MSWVAVGVAGASAVMGSQQAKQQQKAQKAQNMAAAAQTEYSPWTGMGAGEMKSGAPDPGMAAMQGGLTGFMQGQNIKSGMAGASSSAPAEGAVGATAPGEASPMSSMGSMEEAQLGLMKKKPAVYGGSGSGFGSMA